MSEINEFWVKIGNFVGPARGSHAANAKDVAEAIKRVEYRKLTPATRALFLSAVECFEVVCGRCGCPDTSGDFAAMTPPADNDPHFRALKQMAEGRVPGQYDG